MFFSSSVLSRAYCVYLLLLFNSIFNVYSRRMDSFRNTKTTTTVYKYMKASFVLIHFFVFLSFHFSPSIFFFLHTITRTLSRSLARSLSPSLSHTLLVHFILCVRLLFCAIVRESCAKSNQSLLNGGVVFVLCACCCTALL